MALKFFAFGAGFAVALSTMACLLLWYSNRPKPEKAWNQTAIKATAATGSQFRVESDKLVGDFRYSLQNATDTDYRLPNNAKLMVKLAQDLGYRDAPNMTWEQGLYIPAGQKVNVSIILPIMYSDFNFSEKQANDQKELSAFIDRRLAEIDGFVLFDPTSRYKVEFPNGWPQAAARAKNRTEPEAGRSQSK